MQARVAQGESLGSALEKTAKFAARTMRRDETDAERDALAIARRNTEAMKRLGGMIGGHAGALGG